MSFSFLHFSEPFLEMNHQFYGGTSLGEAVSKNVQRSMIEENSRLPIHGMEVFYLLDFFFSGLDAFVEDWLRILLYSKYMLVQA